MRRDGERGAAAVEFAILLPILVMLLFGIISFGMAFWQFQGMQAAAREGARLASIGDVDAGAVAARVESALAGVPGGLDASDVTVTPATACLDTDTETVEVELSGPVDLTVPLWTATTIDVTARGEFRCEGYEP